MFTKICIGLATGAANGLFGAGGGSILVPALRRFIKMDAHKSHATALAAILPLSLISIIFYVKMGETDWPTLALITLGGVVGGFLGAKFLNKIKGVWLRKIFALFILAAAFRMIFS